MFLGQAKRMPMTVCISCRKELDAASGVGVEAKPEPGDVTVCIGCGHIMVFADDLRLRNPKDDEMREIAGRPEIIAIQKARGALK